MIKKIISLTMAVAMSCSLFACGSPKVKSAMVTEAEDFYAYSFDRFGDEVMPIGGYLGPTAGFGYQGNYMPSQIDDEHYKAVKDCGVNFIIGRPELDYKIQPELVKLALECADRNDVMYIVCDTLLYDVNDTNADNKDKYLNVTLDDFQQRVAEYSSYPAFAGLYCKDEPFANMFDQIKAIQSYFDRTFDGNKLLYLNSNSLQCPAGWFGGGPEGSAEEREMTIEGYMDAWFDSFPTLGYYSYDTYPFITQNPGYIRTDIFRNYSLVRQYCEKYKVPFWPFMQTGEELEASMRKINRGEMWWQISTSLAFGAKGYTFYPYNFAPELVNAVEGNDALIGRGGQKNEAWYHAQEANAQTMACDHILMKSTYKGMIQTKSGKSDTTNAVPMPEEELSALNGKFREVVSITGDNAITGCFTYFGKTVLYVVNNSVTLDKAKVTVKFNGNYEFEVIQRAKSNVLTGKSVNLTFAPGEGALIALH